MQLSAYPNKLSLGLVIRKSALKSKCDWVLITHKCMQTYIKIKNTFFTDISVFLQNFTHCIKFCKKTKICANNKCILFSYILRVLSCVPYDHWRLIFLILKVHVLSENKSNSPFSFMVKNPPL